MTYPAWVDELFRAIDTKDADRFASFLTEDGAFVFGNAPPATGRAAVRDVVAGFFASIRSLSHEVRDVTLDGDRVWSRGVVTYVRHHGSSLAVPFCDYFEMRGGSVHLYQIYIDASALYR